MGPGSARRQRFAPASLVQDDDEGRALAPSRLMERGELYASPTVSNIAASIASVVVLPAHTTNWNAGK
ncbi:hypothetical protein AB7M17_003027 [Bradyrhizobium sp. USDA 377]